MAELPSSRCGNYLLNLRESTIRGGHERAAPGGTDVTRPRGVELLGAVEVVGEVPRSGEAPDVPTGPKRLFADTYAGGGEFRYDGRHGRPRPTPEKVVSWDFTKLRR